MSDGNENREKTVEGMRPGRNGGLLKNTAGPGRPEGSVSLVAAMKRHLREDPKRVDELVSAWFRQALDGDTAMAKVFLDRVDGPLPTRLSLNEMSDEQFRAVMERALGVGAADESSE